MHGKQSTGRSISNGISAADRRIRVEWVRIIFVFTPDEDVRARRDEFYEFHGGVRGSV